MRLPEPYQITVFDSPAERKIKSIYNSLLGQLDVSDLAPTPIAAAAKIPAGFAKLLGKVKRVADASKFPSAGKGQRSVHDAIRAASKRFDFAYTKEPGEGMDLYNKIWRILDEAAEFDPEEWRKVFAYDESMESAIGQLKNRLSPEAFQALKQHAANIKAQVSKVKATSAHDYMKSGANQTRREFLVRQSGVPRRWAKEEYYNIDRALDAGMRDRGITGWFEQTGRSPSYKQGYRTPSSVGWGRTHPPQAEYPTSVGDSFESHPEVWRRGLDKISPVELAYFDRGAAINEKLTGGRMGAILEGAKDGVINVAREEARSPIVSKARERAALRSRSLARQKETPGIFRRMLGKFGKGQ